MQDYLPFAETAHLPTERPPLPIAGRDRSGTVFLHLACAAQADALVSGDADLTTLAATAPVRILPPAALIVLMAPSH